MAEVSGDPAPPPIIDPALENLSADQLAQLVNQLDPEVFYQRAQAFDTAAGRLQDARDAFRRGTRQLQEAWSGKVSESFESVAQELNGVMENVLQPMLYPGYGTRLRQAGDAVAISQQRFRELQAHKAQQAALPPVTGAPPPELVEKGNQQSALQITLDLCAVYRDIGMNIAPLPETRPAESGKAGPEVPGGTSGSGDGSVRLVEHTATPPPAEGVLATPLIGPGAVLVSRAGTGTSYSGGPGGTSYGENYPSHANGSGGALDARVPRGEITGSLLGGPGGASQSGFDGSSAFTPGGGVHSGGSTVGRGKPADSKSAGGKAADGKSAGSKSAGSKSAGSKSAGSEPAGGIPVIPGAFPVWAESVRPVLGQRRTVQAVPESEVDGVLGRRSLPGETAVDGVLGRSPAAGTPPDQRRRVAAGLPKTESEPKERLEEGGDKQARPVTVSGDTVVSRAEAAPATPAEHAVAGGAPPASVPPASALPALPASAGSAGNAAAAAADAIARLAPSGQPLFAERGAHLPDPGSGGSAAPGGVPQAVLPVRALPAEGSSALAGGYPTIAGLAGSPGSGAAAGIPPSTGGAPMEGAPMSPMMGAGGMGGQQQEDTERTSEIVPGPDPDVWDYSHGAPAALGRPNQPPAEQEKYESPDEIMARILERRS